MDTVKAVKAIANQLQKNPGWRSNLFQAIENPAELKHPTQEALWQDYRQIHCDLTLEASDRHEKSDELYEANKAAMNECVVELWPEKWSYRSIREKEFEHGRPLILREYQNLPIDRAMAWFKMEDAITFEIDTYGLKRSDGRLVNWEELSGATIFLDWAGAGEVREANCYAAVVTILWEPVPGMKYDDSKTYPAYGYVYSAKLLRGSRTDQLEAHVEELIKVRSFLTLRQSRADYYLRCEDMVDTTGDIKMNFDREYRQIRLKYRFPEHVHFVPRIKSKDDRISALQAPIENGWLCFSTELSELYMDQMRTFPYGDFNDGPDAAEGAWSQPVFRLRPNPMPPGMPWEEPRRRERRLPDFVSYCQ